MVYLPKELKTFLDKVLLISPLLITKSDVNPTPKLNSHKVR